MCTCKNQFFIQTVQNVDVVIGDITKSKADAVILPESISIEGPDMILVHIPSWTGGEKGEIPAMKSIFTSCMEAACEKKYETVDVKAVAIAGSPSDAFAVATAVVRSIKYFMDDNPFPKLVNIICETKELANVYKQAYNYWFAFVKSERIGSNDWEDWKEEK